MDAVGGEMNAFTSQEHTCYYARVLGRRPAAGDRRGLRHGHSTRVIAEPDVDSRARGDPGRDRHARRRPVRPRRRRVRRGAVRADHPLGRAGHRRPSQTIAGDDPRRRSPATTAAGTRRRTWWSRPPAASTTPTCVRLVRTAFRPADCPAAAVRGRRRSARPAPPGRAPARRIAASCSGPPSRPTSCLGVPALARGDPRRYALGVLTQRARRRDELAAVPGDPGEARPGVLGVLVRRRATPTPARSASTRAACRPRSTRCSSWSGSELADGRPRRHHRRGGRRGQGPAHAASSGARPGGHRSRG